MKRRYLNALRACQTLSTQLGIILQSTRSRAHHSARPGGCDSARAHRHNMALLKAGVARVYTPKDFDLTQIMRDVVAVVDGAWKEAA